MDTRIPLVIVLLATASCGGDSPTRATPVPVPIPAASVTTTGNNQWTSCLPIVNTCSFQAEIRNQGQGCAQEVRGTLRFSNPAGSVVGTYNWTTGGGTLRPGETFVFLVPGVPSSIANTGGTYLIVPAWNDVRC